MEIAINKDIFLRGIVSHSRCKFFMTRTGLRLLCIMSIECRYCSPLATPASFSYVLGLVDREENRDRAYEMKAVNSGVL